MKKLLTTVLILFMGVSTFAAENISYDGYYVSKIIDKTTVLFEQKNLLDPYSKTTAEWDRYWNEAIIQQSDGFLPVFPFLDFENSFLSYCVNKNFITYKQANAAIEKCQHVGGTTINGYNLLVLHAEVLSYMIERKRITKQEAQYILDASYEKEK